MKNRKFDFNHIDHDLAFIYAEQLNDYIAKMYLKHLGVFPSTTTYTINHKTSEDEIIQSVIKEFDLSFENGHISIHEDISCVIENNETRRKKNLSECILIVSDYIWITYYTGSYISLLYSSKAGKADLKRVTDLISEKLNSSINVPEKKFGIISRSGISLSIKEFSTRTINLDISSNYNDDFIEHHERISAFLSDKTANGIVLLHGKHGTGKTSYIRYLINQINQHFIYFPIDFIEAVASPDFIPFISAQSGKVLVIEDCEKGILSRESGNNSQIITNLLNLGDGLLGDALNLKLICTFNTNLRQIDKALLRKGRLIDRYEFKDLEMKKAERLAKKLNLKESISGDISLADLYNLGMPDFSKDESHGIGFKI